MVGTDARAHVLGVRRSEAAVKPTRSQNSTETTLRSSRAGASAGGPSGAAHSLQNLAPSGFSFPQLGQIAISGV